MEERDRRTNLTLFAAAGAAWLAVGAIVLTQDPRQVAWAGIAGALAMGVATGLTTVPLFWLAGFARHRRIAFRGDWPRAVRRGAWVGLVVTLLVVLRLLGLFEPELALFIIALVLVAESALSMPR